MLRSRTSVAAAISTIAAMAAALVLTAPATITAFTVTPGDSPVFHDDCAYTARAKTEPRTYIMFHDSKDGEFDPPSVIQ